MHIISCVLCLYMLLVVYFALFQRLVQLASAGMRARRFRRENEDYSHPFHKPSAIPGILTDGLEMYATVTVYQGGPDGKGVTNVSGAFPLATRQPEIPGMPFTAIVENGRGLEHCIFFLFCGQV